MSRWIRDYEEEERLKKEQEQKALECASRPYPYNISNFIPFMDIVCYKEVKEVTNDHTGKD